MGLRDQLATDALAMLADFGESVVYRPEGAAPRTITAIVERFGGDRIRVTVANSATQGIRSSEVDFDRDKIELSRRYGETAEIRDLVPPAEGEPFHDQGAVWFEVR